MESWRINNYEEYLSAYKAAQDSPEEFWKKIADSFQWTEKWTNVVESDLKTGEISWFTGAKLNITENCLDRHLEHNSHKIALIFEPNHPEHDQNNSKSYTFQELYEEVCKCSNMLKKIGVNKGDRVCIYMPMIPDLLISVLACARIGAVHSVVFGGFSAESLATRIQDTLAQVVLTADGAFRGDKVIPLKETVDEALKFLESASVETVVVCKRAHLNITMTAGRDHWWHEALEDCDTECPATAVDSEDPLFVLYTSGSTGLPKGIVHTVAGYMIWAAYTFANVFQVKEESIHWCTADIGWITGHSYICYGPLLTGTTTLMFEGIPTWPDARRFWQIIEKHRVTHFYTAPTALRALQAFPDSFVTDTQRDSLQVLGTVGEPINASAWNWYFKTVGNSQCPVVDTWWQTETGGILIAPLAGITPLRPTYAGLPLPGVSPVLVDDNGSPFAESSAQGNLCIQQSWPGMMRTVYRNHERFLNGYLKPFPGKYFTGDGAIRDIDGFYRITGRVDDVLNVSGHRLGTAEIENAINKHDAVIESAVIGQPDSLTGQAVFVFVVLSKKLNDQDLIEEMRKEVGKHIGSLAKPKFVLQVNGLPKTRSGKIMRRLLRKIVSGETENLGDTSTLLNPEIVTEIMEKFRNQFVCKSVT